MRGCRSGKCARTDAQSSTPLPNRGLENGGTSGLQFVQQNAEDDDFYSPDPCEFAHTIDGQGQDLVSRKRELERQRRNLVNTRFVELDLALSEGAAPTVPQTAPTFIQPRRIDREAVLKDATLRISTLANDIRSVKEQLASMEQDIHRLRTEKLELGEDKSYLHAELVALRSETHQLRSDNIQLWQLIRNSGCLKSVFSTVVDKIPAEILLRAQLSQNTHTHLSTMTSSQPTQQPRNDPAIRNEGHMVNNAGECPRHQQRQVGRSQHVVSNSFGATSDSFQVFQSSEEFGESLSGYQVAEFGGQPQDTLLPIGVDKPNHCTGTRSGMLNENINLLSLLQLDAYQPSSPLVAGFSSPRRHISEQRQGYQGQSVSSGDDPPDDLAPCA